MAPTVLDSNRVIKSLSHAVDPASSNRFLCHLRKVFSNGIGVLLLATIKSKGSTCEMLKRIEEKKKKKKVKFTK